MPRSAPTTPRGSRQAALLASANRAVVRRSRSPSPNNQGLSWDDAQAIERIRMQLERNRAFLDDRSNRFSRSWHGGSLREVLGLRPLSPFGAAKKEQQPMADQPQRDLQIMLQEPNFSPRSILKTRKVEEKDKPTVALSESLNSAFSFTGSDAAPAFRFRAGGSRSPSPTRVAPRPRSPASATRSPSPAASSNRNYTRHGRNRKIESIFAYLDATEHELNSSEAVSGLDLGLPDDNTLEDYDDPMRTNNLNASFTKTPRTPRTSTPSPTRIQSSTATPVKSSSKLKPKPLDTSTSAGSSPAKTDGRRYTQTIGNREKPSAVPPPTAVLNSMSLASDTSFRSGTTADDAVLEEDPSRLSKAQIVSMQLELGDKRKILGLLRDALKKEKNLRIEDAEIYQSSAQSALKEMREKYEDELEKHQSFIDRLINDKASLSEQCEKLVADLKALDTTHTKRMQTLQDRHIVELKKQKERFEAAERNRREAWVHEKTAQIRDLTVKGLEPDIQRIVAQHRQEIKHLQEQQALQRAKWQAETVQRVQEAAQNVQAEGALEERLMKQHEEKLAAVRTKYEGLLAEAESEQMALRRRLTTKFDEEKCGLLDQIERLRSMRESNTDDLASKHVQQLQKQNQVHADEIQELKRRHTAALHELKRNIEVERSEYATVITQQLERSFQTREDELRTTLCRERDREIDMVIARIEEEFSQQQLEMLRNRDSQFKRVSEDLEHRLSEAKRSETAAVRMYHDSTEQISNLENTLVKAQNDVRERDVQLSRLRTELRSLSATKEELDTRIRAQYDSQLTAVEKRAMALEKELDAVRQAAGKEFEDLVRERDNQLDQVNERVRQTVAHRDQTLHRLREDLDAENVRVAEYKRLLEQQRAELLDVST
eukprot:Clim_evm26s214 gene=Clim_evmTU26s214